MRRALRAAEAKRLPPVVAEPLDYLRRNAGLKSVSPLFSERRQAIQRLEAPAAARQQLALLSSVADSASKELEGITVGSLDPKQLTPALLSHLRASKGIEWIEPMPARWLAAGTPDPLCHMQWGLQAIHLFHAQPVDAQPIRVGVLDTGIDRRHPDLPGATIEYEHGRFSRDDLLGHGTHVAGIIAAITYNGVGIAGVAGCRLCVWKVFPDEPAADGEFYLDGESYLQALAALAAAGVKVVNLSLGGTASSRAEELLFRRLEREKILVVAAMGNEYAAGNPTEYPAAYPGVLAVGSVAENLRRSPFSNTGEHIGLVAPGSNIHSTVPTQRSRYRRQTDYATWSGTSFATPHVTAAAALVAARFPSKRGSQIKDRLLDTATKLRAMGNRRRTPAYGAGLLNLEQALQ